MDSQVIIEPDIIGNEKKRYCNSCLTMSSFYIQSNITICYNCKKPMLKGESLPELNAVQDEPAKLPPLTLQEMKQNTEIAKQAFEKLEKLLSKIRGEKFALLESAGDNVKILELSREDEKIAKESNNAYDFWQMSKKNYESALKDSENQILAKAYFAEYTTGKVEQRAAKAQVFLNRLSELNNLISLVASELTDEFLSVQFGGLNEMQRLVSKLKEMRISRINGVDISQMRNDSVGSIKPLCQEIGREITLTERHIALLEDCVQKVRKSINFDMLNRGV